MTWLLILGFAVSSSLDNLGLGITYGIRKIKIGFFSNFVIACVCFIFSYSGIKFGKWISTVLPGILPILLSAFVLLVIGLRIILLAAPRKQAENKKNKRVEGAVGVERNDEASKRKRSGFGEIFRNPECVDLDHSNDIGIIEALILGIALSANALTNGLSAGLLGLSPLLISLTSALGSFITVGFGVWLGARVANVRIGSFTLGQFGTLLSGIILVLIAVHSIFLN